MAKAKRSQSGTGAAETSPPVVPPSGAELELPTETGDAPESDASPATAAEATAASEHTLTETNGGEREVFLVPGVVGPGEVSHAEVTGDGSGQALPPAILDADGVASTLMEFDPATGSSRVVTESHKLTIDDSGLRLESATGEKLSIDNDGIQLDSENILLEGNPVADHAPLAEDTEAAERARATFDALPDGEKTDLTAKLEELGDTVKPESDAPMASAPPKPPARRRYVVWAHGELHRDGIVHKPGAELDLPTEIGDALGCLIPADD